ncbi:MAG: ribosome-associated translation inhibitor RaiA [Chitinophagales bacterium]|nr:ribosome-associated translation inhibitor RaiA [Chitinophagales bacterium]
MEIRIQSIHFDADQKLLDYVEKRVSKVSTFFNHITGVDVYLKFDSAHSHIKEKAVELKVIVPGATIFASETSLHFEEAVDNAVESLKRQLKKHKEKVQN